MIREFDAVIQMGHVARTRGATGTRGHRGSEQDFVKILGPMIADRLVAAGLTVSLIGADDPRPTAEVFLALHQDGSNSNQAHGASVGYPIHGDGGTLAKIWKSRYTLAGWPFGFRGDNYTVGLHYYYGFGGLRRTWWQKAKFSAAFLIEHGFATNTREEEWMWNHFDAIADADAGTIIQYLRPKGSEVTIRMGDKGPAVTKIQETLNTFSKAGLVVDGDFGPATRAAVIAYQTKLHVSPANGLWDLTTVTANAQFMNYLRAQPAPPAPPESEPLLKQLRKLVDQVEVLISDIDDLLSEAD